MNERSAGWVRVGGGALAALLAVSALGWVPLAGLRPAGADPAATPPSPGAVPVSPPVVVVSPVSPVPAPVPVVSVPVVSAPVVSVPVAPAPVVSTPAPAPVTQQLTSVSGAHGPLALTVHVSHERPWIQDGSVWVRCGVSVGEPADLPPREPVRLVLVLDVSGSMSGAMPLLRAATRGIAQRLSGEDQLVIVTYSNDARQVFAGNPVQHGAELEAAIGRLGPEGGTNMGAGLQVVAELLSSSSARGRGCDAAPPLTSRVLLLTDGLANQGITTPEGLSELVSTLRGRGTAVSCMGLGASYNEQLLGQLADVGGGRYHYVDRAEALEQVYAAELDQARRTVAQAAQLRLLSAPGVRVAEVVSWSWSREGEGALVDLGTLSAGRQLKVLARLELVGPEARRTGALVDVASTALSWTAPAGRSLQSGALSLPAVQVWPVETAGEVRRVAELAGDLQQLEVAREVARATEEARAGRGGEARRRLMELKDRLGENELRYEGADGSVRAVELDEMAEALAAPGAGCERAAKEAHAFGQSAVR